MHQSRCSSLAFVLLSALLTSNLYSCAMGKPQPQYTSLDAFDDSSFYAPPPYDEPISDYRLSRLRRGFYYVDDGHITAVPASAVVASPSRSLRRADGGNSNSDEDGAYTPLLTYRQEHTKHKKLFVPNLYG